MATSEELKDKTKNTPLNLKFAITNVGQNDICLVTEILIVRTIDLKS